MLRRVRDLGRALVLIGLGLGLAGGGGLGVLWAGEESPVDPRAVWLRDNALPLATVDPAVEDFSDLEPLRQVLDGVRVVMLGEPSHGDGSVFLLKARLIRFLHLEMGFDVLAFESGFFDCAAAWESMERGADVREAFDSAVFPIWSRSRQVEPVVELLAERVDSERPLALAGFDSQLTGRASQERLVPALNGLLARLGIGAGEVGDLEPLRVALGHLARGSYEVGEEPPPPRRQQRALRKTLERLRRAVTPAAVAGDAEAAFWRQLLESLDSQFRISWATDPEAQHVDSDLARRRDRQMADNLLWLARERYPDKKIVVWAATLHIARHLGELEISRQWIEDHYDKVTAMGEYVERELGEKAYALGFIALEGNKGSVFARETQYIVPPSRGSLEELAGQAGLELAWIDFRNPPEGGDWLGEPLIARPLGFREMRGRWPRLLDGMVFLRTMEASRPRDRGPGS